jgi:DNA-binding response OmpR family regulator
MTSFESRANDVAIIDASIDDYSVFFSDEQLQKLPCRQFSTGEEALQQLDPLLATLWLVNMRLPDMSGIGFLHLVRCRSRRCPVFLVGDEYRPEEELAARAAGASAYLCKPVNAGWLRLCRSATTRAPSAAASRTHCLQSNPLTSKELP